MFTALDWVVHLEASRSSLSRSGQERLARLAWLKLKSEKPAKKAAAKPVSQPAAAPATRCEPSVA